MKKENEEESDISKKQEKINLKNMKEAADQIQEQINLIREQIANRRHLMQTKGQEFVYNAKSQIIEITHKIERDILNIKKNAVIIEEELLHSQNQETDKNISFLQELTRKAIHLTSLAIPICYIFFLREEILMVIVPIMILAIVSDLATKRNVFLRSLYLKAFGFLLRKHEIKTKKMLLNGASWVMISSVLTIYFFPKLIAIVGLSILFISDMVAAIIGRKYGKRRFLGLKKKSWAGTVAFFASAMFVVIIYGVIFNVPYLYYLIGLFASVGAAVGEAISKKILRTDDNLTIPISFGIIMWMGNIYCLHFFQIDCFGVF
jgi:dolichol kinase